MPPHHLSRPGRVALAAAALLFVVTACSPTSTQPSSSGAQSSSSTSQSSSSTSPSQDAACADAAALRSSLEALTTIQPLQDGTTATKAAIANVKTSLDKAAASASAALKPSVQQVKTAVDGLQTAVDGLTNDNLKQKAPAIADALRQVATATSALAATVKQNCPGS